MSLKRVSVESKREKNPAFWLSTHKNWLLFEKRSIERKLTMEYNAHKEQTRDKIWDQRGKNEKNKVIQKKSQKKESGVAAHLTWYLLKNDTCQWFSFQSWAAQHSISTLGLGYFFFSLENHSHHWQKCHTLHRYCCRRRMIVIISSILLSWAAYSLFFHSLTKRMLSLLLVVLFLFALIPLPYLLSSTYYNNSIAFYSPSVNRLLLNK